MPICIIDRHVFFKSPSRIINNLMRSGSSVSAFLALDAQWTGILWPTTRGAVRRGSAVNEAENAEEQGRDLGEECNRTKEAIGVSQSAMRVGSRGK